MFRSRVFSMSSFYIHSVLVSSALPAQSIIVLCSLCMMFTQYFHGGFSLDDVSDGQRMSMETTDFSHSQTIFSSEKRSLDRNPRKKYI